jgi:hypothetical protein
VFFLHRCRAILRNNYIDGEWELMGMFFSYRFGMVRQKKHQHMRGRRRATWNAGQGCRSCDSLPGRESSQHFTPVIALAWGDRWINFGFFSRFRSTKWPGSENPVRSLRKVSGRKYKMRMEHLSVAGALDGLFHEGLPCPWADKNPICRLGHLCYPRLGGDMALLCHAVV